jgi:uncharacterized membrane protein
VKILAMVLGFIVATIGAVGVVAPDVLLELGESLLTPTVLYIAAAVRVIFGAVLLWVAPVSRTPKTLRVFGVLLVLAGVITPSIGIEHSRATLDWLLSQGPLFMRAWAGVAVVLGLFIVYALTGPRRFAA